MVIMDKQMGNLSREMENMFEKGGRRAGGGPPNENSRADKYNT